MKGQNAILTGIMLLVSAIIGFAILDAVNAPLVTHTLSSSETDLNVSTEQTLSPVGDGILSLTAVNNSNGAALVNAIDYNYTASTGVYHSYEPANHTAVNITWTYDSGDDFDSGISRTIGFYIIPVGLLAAIGIAAYLMI